METQKEALTAQDQFASEVGDALERAFEELGSTFEGVNRDFAREVKIAASKHAMSGEQIEKVLADFGGNEGNISIGPGRRLPGPMNFTADVLAQWKERASRKASGGYGQSK